MKITVTDEMIAEEVKYPRCRYCPVARAINEVLKEEYHVVTDGRIASIVPDGPTIHLPPPVATFVMTYDHATTAFGPRPAAISFEIDIPNQYLRSL